MPTRPSTLLPALLLLALHASPALAEPTDASSRLHAALKASVARSPELATTLAELDVDSADAAGAVAPGLPWIEGEVQDRRWPGGGHADGSTSIRLGVPFHYPWQWLDTGRLSREAGSWRQVAGRAALLEHSRELGVAWLDWATAIDKGAITARWLARAEEVGAQEKTRLKAGSLSALEGTRLQWTRAEVESRHFETLVEKASLAAELRRIAGAEVPEAQEGDLLALVSSTQTPAAGLDALRERMRRAPLFLATVAEADRDRAEGQARASTATGTPRIELGLRQDVEELFVWDLEGALALRLPIPAGRQVRKTREEGRAMERAGESARQAAEARFDLLLQSANDRARVAQTWMDSQTALLQALPAAESALASQYQLGESSGSDYLRDLDRFVKFRLQTLDAARELLLARLDLALLLQDPSLFPAAFPGSGE